MTTQVLPKDKSLSSFVARSPATDKLCKNILLKKLTGLKNCYLTIKDSKDIYEFGDRNSTLKSDITIKRSSFYSRTVLGGSIGNAESFIDEDWETSSLTDLIRIFVLNRPVVQEVDGGIGKLLQPFQKYFHGLRENTINGSRENIRAHYDIGNDFFKLFLDETMMYSSAMFDNAHDDLVTASMKKVKTIGEKLKIKPTDRVIEIGTGWGTMAIHLARTYGCHVTTTTISSQQFNYAVQKVNELGLQEKVTVLFEDYRKLTGTYDKLVSVEMIEAVGLDHLDEYFAKCSSLLKPDGLMVIQAITIRDQFYESAKKSVDFIQRHIFPGSGIPSIHAMMNSVTSKTDLALIHQNDFAEDYAQTLNHWAKNLENNKDQITKLGYPEFLYRLWKYYFSYCEGGFRERAIGVSQLCLAKPQFKDRSFV
jgi:cyclopropane-fatty-acyl-phospholipid synthase